MPTFCNAHQQPHAEHLTRYGTQMFCSMCYPERIISAGEFVDSLREMVSQWHLRDDITPERYQPGDNWRYVNIIGKTITRYHDVVTWRAGFCDARRRARLIAKSFNRQVQQMQNEFKEMMEYVNDKEKVNAALSVLHNVDLTRNRWSPEGDTSESSMVIIDPEEGITIYLVQ